MDLPISYDEALEEWERFEKYLIQARYAIRDPKTGLPTEDDFPHVMVRVSSQFDHPGVTKALSLGQIIDIGIRFFLKSIDTVHGSLQQLTERNRAGRRSPLSGRGNPLRGHVIVLYGDIIHG